MAWPLWHMHKRASTAMSRKANRSGIDREPKPTGFYAAAKPCLLTFPSIWSIHRRCMSNTILTKKYYDLQEELYQIASNLVIKADLNDPHAGLKPYIQWSKSSMEPLEDAIEQLVQRVRDDTKAGNKVFTRAEQAKLNDLAADMRRRDNEEVFGGV